jgi:hypothetical protein
MDLILIVDYIDKFAVLKDVVLKLNEFLVLSHKTLLVHPFDLKGGRINSEALISQVCVQKSSKDHDLCVIDSKATELASLRVAARTLKEYKFPMSRPIKVVGGSEVEPLYCCQTTAIVYCGASSDGVNE